MESLVVGEGREERRKEGRREEGRREGEREREGFKSRLKILALTKGVRLLR